MAEGLTLAQSAAAAGWAFDVKAAYALPLGNVWNSEPWTRAPVPFAMSSAAFAKDTNFFAGPFNSGYDMRVGIEMMYEILPSDAQNPWFLVGTGWEWTNFSGPSSNVTVSGWEYLVLQAGLDFTVARAFGIGPYVGFTAGTYSSLNTGGQPGGGQIPTDTRAFHGWFQVGVKGTLNL